MNYWEDKRDDLEKYYPTCSSFCVFHENYPENLIEGIDCGVIFLMAFWSAQAIRRFKSACYGLEDSVRWDRFSFQAIDIDGLHDDNPFAPEERLGGYGETFWIKDGVIVSSLGVVGSPEQSQERTDRIIN